MELDQTLFPNPNFLSSPTLDPKSRSKSSLRSWIEIYTIEILLTTGWENFLKIH